MTYIAYKYNDYQTGFSDIKSLDVASYLKKTFTQNDEVLVENIIASVEDSICRKTNRQFNYSLNYYEELDGGFNLFEPRLIPLNSLVKVWIDGVDVTTNYTAGTNYWVYDGSIRFLEYLRGSTYNFKDVRLDYKINQFWGDELKLAVKQIVGKIYLDGENAGVGISNFNFADLGQELSLGRWDSMINNLLFRYTIHNI